jgi:hypothetical protein
LDFHRFEDPKAVCAFHVSKISRAFERESASYQRVPLAGRIVHFIYPLGHSARRLFYVANDLTTLPSIESQFSFDDSCSCELGWPTSRSVKKNAPCGGISLEVEFL